MEFEEWWRRPQSTQKQNEKETEAHEVFPTEHKNSNSAPKTNVTTRTACIKKTLTLEIQFFQMRQMNQR
jgi:hypothetical protein